MSRIGKAPVVVPDKIKVEIVGTRVTVTGPKGSIGWDVPAGVAVKLDGHNVVVTRDSDLKKHRALHGLTRALIANMVEGVSVGYKRQLKIIGVGYRAELKGRNLVFYLGFSHPILFRPPDGVKFEYEPKENVVSVIGIEKDVVGATAAKIRSLKKPEPYKGKGVRYIDEHVQIKAGKTAG
jgi:large subunit ribosomal protein L6